MLQRPAIAHRSPPVRASRSAARWVAGRGANASAGSPGRKRTERERRNAAVQQFMLRCNIGCDNMSQVAATIPPLFPASLPTQ